MDAKKKVYFCGSIRGGRDYEGKYAEIINSLNKKYQVLTEHIGFNNLERFESGKTDEFIYLRDKSLLDQADFVVAECSVPSLGVGYELAYSEAHRKPVYVLYDLTTNMKLSAMIAGDANFKKLYYSSDEELLEIVEKL